MQVRQDWTEADVPVQVAQVEGQLEHLVTPDWV